MEELLGDVYRESLNTNYQRSMVSVNRAKQTTPFAFFTFKLIFFPHLDKQIWYSLIEGNKVDLFRDLSLSILKNIRYMVKLWDLGEIWNLRYDRLETIGIRFVLSLCHYLFFFYGVPFESDWLVYFTILS